jgi:hypothetical protein
MVSSADEAASCDQAAHPRVARSVRILPPASAVQSRNVITITNANHTYRIEHSLMFFKIWLFIVNRVYLKVVIL